MNVQPFSPTGPTVTLSATTTTSNGNINAGSAALRVVNAGTAAAFIRWGTGAQTAVITDLPILPSSMEIFCIPPSATNVGVITGTGTATVYVTPGEGQ